VVAEAPSGSGKTLAFGAACLSAVDPSVNAPQVLVLAPTGKLAEQLTDVFVQLARFVVPRPRVVCVTAGVRVHRRALQPQVIVATPNRLLDLCGLLDKARSPSSSSSPPPVLALGAVRLFVADEADEFLDRPESTSQLAALVRRLPLAATMAFFSATMTRTTLDLIDAENLVRTEGPRACVRIGGGDGSGSSGAIERLRPALAHFSVHLGDGLPADADWECRGDAVADLCELFGACSLIVFCKSKAKVDFLAQALKADQRGSRFVTDLGAFRARPNLALLATDACSRGIDVGGVACVINFEVPTSGTSYTQRTGRAGRLGKSGTALTLVAGSSSSGAGEGRQLAYLEHELGFDLPGLPNELSSLPGAGRYDPARALQEAAAKDEAAAAVKAVPPMRSAVKANPPETPSGKEAAWEAVPCTVPLACAPATGYASTPSQQQQQAPFPSEEPPLATSSSSALEGREELLAIVAALTGRIAALEAKEAQPEAAAVEAEAAAEAAAATTAALEAQSEAAAAEAGEAAAETAAAEDYQTSTFEEVAVAHQQLSRTKIVFGEESEELVVAASPEVETTLSEPPPPQSSTALTTTAPAAAAVDDATAAEWLSVSAEKKKHPKVMAPASAAVVGVARWSPTGVLLLSPHASPHVPAPAPGSAGLERLGSGALAHGLVVPGAVFRGQVVTALARGSFLRFGSSGAGACGKDGYARGARLAVGTWHTVRVVSASWGGLGKVDLAVVR